MNNIQKIITLETMIIQYSTKCLIRTPFPLEMYTAFGNWKQLHRNGNIILCGNNSPKLSLDEIECLALLNRPAPAPVMRIH